MVSIIILGGRFEMSFLTDNEAASLQLTRMSLHIVGGEDEFQPQPELAVEHDDFLLRIIKEIAADSVYSFQNTSLTKATIERISAGEITFEAGSQALASDFRRLHVNSAKDGAFFVFELSVEDARTAIFALVKYDYSRALEIVHGEGVQKLRQIVEAFVSSRSAIQKSAIIRIHNGSAQAQISTRDRMGRPSPLLTDFFQNYLDVTRDRDDAQLTTDGKEVVRRALQENANLLPQGGLAASVSRANNVLRDADQINERVITQAVWVGAGQPEAPETREQFEKSANKFLAKGKMGGLAFAPARAVLPRALRRTVTTEEGVRLEYNTALQGQAVVIQDLPDGQTRFIVTTRNYKDDVQPDRVRRTT
jgi:37-kD nucleoid-associated bacterial protein